MKKRWLVAGALGLLAAFPATASAAPDVRDVAKKVRSADAALDLAREAAERGDVEALLDSLRAARVQAGRAERKSDRLRGELRQSRALRKIAKHHDATIDSFAALIDRLPAEVQPIVLDALARATAVRDALVQRLIELSEELPEPAATAILDLIAGLHSDGELESIATAIGSDSVGPGVRAALTDLFGELAVQLEGVLERLDGVSAELPPKAQEHVRDAIDRIRELAEVAGGILEGVLDGLPLPGGEGGPRLPDRICDALAILPIPIPLCPESQS